MANTVHLKRVYGNRFEIVVPGMAKKEATKMSKARNKQKKTKHKKGRPKKIKSPISTPSPIPSPSPVHMSPASQSPKPSHSPTEFDSISIHPVLKLAQCTSQSTVPERPRTSKISEICEYYPLKLKRSNPKKKTILKHNYNLKNINERRKRKATVPQKGAVTEHKDPQRIEYSELSMTEIVRFMEDTTTLDDDDLMEILTCPSPVWWEDPPSDAYCEEPIDKDLVKEAREGISESPPPIEEDVHLRVQLLNRQNKNNDKLMTKKNKLENILGNLKKKISNVKKVDDNENGKEDRNFPNISNGDEIIKNDIEVIKHVTVNNENIPYNNEITRNEINQHNFNEIVLADDEFHNSKNDEGVNAIANVSTSRLSDSSEGDILSDISINEEELLKNLETIEIPIEQSTPEKRNETDPKANIVPNTLPPLLKFSYLTTIDSFNQSPKSRSFESSREKSSDDVISGEFDSISDTNVRFLDDDDVEMLSRTEDVVSDTIDLDETPIIDNISVTSSSIDKLSDKASDSTSSSEKSEVVQVPKCLNRPRKALKNKKDPKYKGVKVVSYFKNNKYAKKVNKGDSGSNSEQRTGFMSMPRNIANQRKLNYCGCGEICCVHCFSNRNLFRTVDNEGEGVSRVNKRV